MRQGGGAISELGVQTPFAWWFVDRANSPVQSDPGFKDGHEAMLDSGFYRADVNWPRVLSAVNLAVRREQSTPVETVPGADTATRSGARKPAELNEDDFATAQQWVNFWPPRATPQDIGPADGTHRLWNAALRFDGLAPLIDEDLIYSAARVADGVTTEPMELIASLGNTLQWFAEPERSHLAAANSVYLANVSAARFALVGPARDAARHTGVRRVCIGGSGKNVSYCIRPVSSPDVPHALLEYGCANGVWGIDRICNDWRTWRTGLGSRMVDAMFACHPSVLTWTITGMWPDAIPFWEHVARSHTELRILTHQGRGPAIRS